MAETKKSSPALIAGAWLVVLLPALWGLSYTGRNALKLFSVPATSAAPSVAPSTSPSAASSAPERR